MSKGANVTPRVLSVRAASSLDEKVALTSAHTTSHATSPPSLGHLRDASRESGPKVGSGTKTSSKTFDSTAVITYASAVHGGGRLPRRWWCAASGLDTRHAAELDAPSSSPPRPP